MAKDLSKIIVIDLEATCTEKTEPNFINEIIEIGIAELDVKRQEITKNWTIMVQPRWSEVTEFCTQLTTIHPEMVTAEAGAVTLNKAIQVLEKEYPSLRKMTWASYGDYDRRQFERQCGREGVMYPFGVTHINVKNLAALYYALPREVGMDAMLEHMGFELEGVHHRGIDDARNIAKILSKVVL